MAIQARKFSNRSAYPEGQPAILPASHERRSPSVRSEERERLIREAAYARFARRGFVHGHDMEDWLMAEAEVDRMMSNTSAGEAAEVSEDRELHQSGSRSIVRDETMKRILKQHPLRDAPKV